MEKERVMISMKCDENKYVKERNGKGREPKGKRTSKGKEVKRRVRDSEREGFIC